MPRRLILTWIVGTLLTAEAPGQEPPSVFSVQDVDTLKQVLQRIQEFRADGITTPVIIKLAGSVYHLSEPLRLAPDVVGRGLTLKGDRPGEVPVFPAESRSH